MTERVLQTAMTALESRTSRHGFLVRVTLGATALAVAPLRYLLRPGSAWAASTCSSDISCGTSCSNGHCDVDGYTTFCCTITGSNNCPSNSFVGGWWSCTYTGSHLCSAQGIRYYFDCQINPSSSCTPQCANGNCANRHTCCTCFRYGQCNTQITTLTLIVCRVVRCIAPHSAFSACNNSPSFTDQTTCSQEADCIA